MAELATEIGISRATLYRYFKTRDELISALATDSLERITAGVQEVPTNLQSYREAFRLLLQALLSLADRYHFVANEPRCLRDPAVKLELERQYAEMFTMIDDAKAAGEIRPELPAAWVASCFDAVLWSAWWTVREGHVAPNDAETLAFETFWRGAGTNV